MAPQGLMTKPPQRQRTPQDIWRDQQARARGQTPAGARPMGQGPQQLQPMPRPMAQPPQAIPRPRPDQPLPGVQQGGRDWQQMPGKMPYPQQIGGGYQQAPQGLPPRRPNGAWNGHDPRDPNIYSKDPNTGREMGTLIGWNQNNNPNWLNGMGGGSGWQQMPGQAGTGFTQLGAAPMQPMQSSPQMQQQMMQRLQQQQQNPQVGPPMMPSYGPGVY